MTHHSHDPHLRQHEERYAPDQRLDRRIFSTRRSGGSALGIGIALALVLALVVLMSLGPSVTTDPATAPDAAPVAPATAPDATPVAPDPAPAQ